MFPRFMPKIFTNTAELINRVQLLDSPYVGQVNFNRSRRLSIYGIEVLRQLRKAGSNESREEVRLLKIAARPQPATDGPACN